MDATKRETINRTRRDDLQGVHRPLADALDEWLVKQHGVMSSAHAVGSFLADLDEAGLQVIAKVCDEQCCEDAACDVPWHHPHRLQGNQGAPGLTPHARAELAALAKVEGPGKAAAILTMHSRHRGGCLCGELKLGQRHAEHQVDELRAAGVLPPADGLVTKASGSAAELTAPSVSPGTLVAALGSAQSPPDALMGTLTAYRAITGDIVVEHHGGPLLSLSLQLFAQQHDTDTGPRFIRVRDGVVVVSGVDAQGDPCELRYRAVGLQLADPQYLAAQEGGYLLLERLGS
jgi:hypothetical protein